jgi:hypothetical protein
VRISHVSLRPIIRRVATQFLPAWELSENSISLFSHDDLWDGDDPSHFAEVLDCGREVDVVAGASGAAQSSSANRTIRFTGSMAAAINLLP